MAGQWHESEVYISLLCLFFRGRWGYLNSNTAWSFQHSSNFRIRSSLHDGTWLISITTWQAYLHHGCQLFGMTHCILKKKNWLLICPKNSVNHILFLWLSGISWLNRKAMPGPCMREKKHWLYWFELAHKTISATRDSCMQCIISNNLAYRCQYLETLNLGYGRGPT